MQLDYLLRTLDWNAQKWIQMMYTISKNVHKEKYVIMRALSTRHEEIKVFL